MIANIEEAIRSIEAEKEIKVESVRQEVIQNVVIPYNAKIDEGRNNALAELEQKRDVEISAITQRYEAEKQKIIEATETNKKTHEISEINKATELCTHSYEKTLAKLKELVAGIQE